MPATQFDVLGCTTEIACNYNADEIKKLAELKDNGILTEEEFQAKKKELLGL